MEHGMLWLLWNRRERRLRAGWRILAMLALYLALTVATMAAVETFLPTAERYVAPVAIAATGTLAAWLPCRYLDRRPLRSLGLAIDRTWWREFGVGMLLGLLLAGGVLVVYLAAGWVSVTGWFAAEDGSFATSLGLLVAMYVAVAYLEEVLFRGYFVTNATEGFSRASGTDRDQPRRRGWPRAMPVTLAVAVSSLVFPHFHGDSLTAMQYGTSGSRG
jgi:uncharacterized protein